MAKNNTNPLWMIGLIIVIGFFIIQSGALKTFGINPFNIPFAATLNPEQYVEYRCENVSSYKAEGYTFSSYDEHGCEIVVMSIQTYGSTVNCGFSNSIYPDCSACPCPSGMSGRCQGGSGSNVYNACTLWTDDYRGGYTQVINTCNYETNDLLAVEGFTGGQTINKFSTRYPVKGFCKAHPAIIMNQNTQQSSTSTNILDDLLKGNSLNIPANEEWTIFYVLENNYQLPTICKYSDGLALNTETNTCVSSLGIVFICSQGQFKPSLGLCVIQPNSTCEYGRLEINEYFINGVKYYNYTCVFNPQIQADCSVYGNAYYSVNLDKCVKIPDIVFSCPSDYVLYKPTLSECLAKGYRWLEYPGCPEGQACSYAGTPMCEQGQECQKEAVQVITQNITTYVCPEGTAKDESYVPPRCVIQADVEQICSSGIKVWDDITQKYICQVTTSPTLIYNVKACLSLGGQLSADNLSCITAPLITTNATGCPLGTQYVAGECKLINQSSVCPMGSIYIDGQCVTQGKTTDIWKGILGTLGIIGVIIVIIIALIIILSLVGGKK